jgi:hypothetical protein
LREERRLRVYENRVLRRICEPKRDEVLRQWRKLHNEELNVLYSSPDIVRVIKSRMRWAGHVAGMGRIDLYAEFWYGNMRVRDHLEDPGVSGKIIFLVLQEVGYKGMGWIDLVHDRDSWQALVNAVMNIRVSYNVGNFMTI